MAARMTGIDNPSLATRQCNVAVLAVVIVFAIACRDPSPVSNDKPQITTECLPSADAGRYFGDDSVGGREISIGFARLLEAGAFSPLWCSGSSDAYRLVWMPSFRPAIVIVVTRSSEGWVARGAQYADPRQSASSGVTPLQVVNRVSRPVNEETVQDLTGWLRQAQFWTSTSSSNPSGFDGHLALIEGWRDGEYHAVGVRNPTGAFAEAARTMVVLAGLDVPAEMERRRPSS